MTVAGLKLLDSSPFIKGLLEQGARLGRLVNHETSNLYSPESVELVQSLHQAVDAISESLINENTTELLRKLRLTNIKEKFAELGTKLHHFFQYIVRNGISLPAITAPNFIDSLLVINTDKKPQSAETIVGRVRNLVPDGVLEDTQLHSILTYTLYQAGINRQEVMRATGLSRATVYRHYDEYTKNIISQTLKAARARLFIAQEYRKYENKLTLDKIVHEKFGIGKSTADRIIDKYRDLNLIFTLDDARMALITLINSAPRQAA